MSPHIPVPKRSSRKWRRFYSYKPPPLITPKPPKEETEEESITPLPPETQTPPETTDQLTGGKPETR